MKNTIQNIINAVAAAESLSYDIYPLSNKVEIVIEDFDGFTEDWDEIILDVNEDEVAWAKSLNGKVVEGWAIEVHWASEDI